MSDHRITRDRVPAATVSLSNTNNAVAADDQQAGSLSAQSALLEQQINAMAPGPAKDKMLQAHQAVLAAVARFEELSGKSPAADTQVNNNPQLDLLRDKLEAAIARLVNSANLPGINSSNLPGTLKQSRVTNENSHNALKQFQTADKLYSQRKKRELNNLQQQIASTQGNATQPQTSPVQGGALGAAPSLRASSSWTPIPPTNPWDPNPAPAGSDFYTFYVMLDQINQINTQYVLAYQDIMGGDQDANPATFGYTKFFTDLSDAMGEKTNYLSAGSTTGNITFKYQDFQAEFDSKMAIYTQTTVFNPNYPPSGRSGPAYKITSIPYFQPSTGTQQDAIYKYWVDNLGDGFVVVNNPGVGVDVYIDTQIVKDMSQSITDSFNGPSGPTDMLQQIYSSWETSFNGNQNTVSTTVQRIGDLYSSANRTFDNLAKIMSSAFQSCVDCAKNFLTI